MTRGTTPFDPADDGIADQPPTTTGGQTRGRAIPLPASTDEVIGLDKECHYTTPRKYDEPADNDVALPTDDSTLGTKI